MKSVVQQEHPQRGEGNPNSIKVLVYHRIVDEPTISQAHWSCLTVERFREHLELLDRLGYTTITFKDYFLFLEGQVNLPAKPIILTFDDGYLDTYRFAFPLLQEFGMTAVMFVLGDRKIRTNYWDQRIGVPEAALMDKQHIVEMHEAGFEIGSHSASHARLTTISEGSAWEEISRSRILLEILLNGTVNTFSYPYGLLSGTLKRMVHNAGYSIACGVHTGPAVFGKDLFEIRRIAIRNTTGSFGLALRLLTPYHYYNWLRWKVGRTLTNGKHVDQELQKILEKKKRRANLTPPVETLEEYDAEK
ncbi:MAG: polysaccharide deacetylase family protein [Bacteroidota bacterium]